MLGVDEVTAGDVVLLRDGRTVEVGGLWSEWHDAEGTHPGPGITVAKSYEHVELAEVAELVARNERRCRFCGGGVTSTNPDVDFCRVCFYTGRAFSESRADQVARFEAAFPGSDVGVEHTGGGCFWFSVRWDGRDDYYVLTDGEAGLPSDSEGTPVLSGGWGYVGRHSDDEDSPDYDGHELRRLPDALDDPQNGLTDEAAIEVIREDLARRKGGV